MSRFIDLKLVGAGRLQKKFNKLERKVQTKSMRDATKKALEPVLQLAKSQAPTGDSGRLVRFLKIATFRGKNKTGAVVQTGTRRQMGLSSEAEYYYPAAHEYGTRQMTAPPGGFLRSALAKRRRVALNILRTELKRLIGNA